MSTSTQRILDCKRSITAPVNNKDVLKIDGTLINSSTTFKREFAPPARCAGGAGGVGGAAPAGGAPPVEVCNCFVLDLVRLLGTTNVPHSGGHSGVPAGCSRERAAAAG